MFIPSDLATQLAREYYRRMLGDASQRQLQHQHGRPAPDTPSLATRITRRLAAAVARAGSAAAQAPGAIWHSGPARADGR